MTELTILMPCLNEHETIAFCVDEAMAYLTSRGIAGEVLVADNLSTDGSADIALSHGARVVSVTERGYGSALRAGISAARGRFVIMGDCDGSYDFSALDGFVSALRAGAHLVMGNRYAGGIEKGAMPFSHRYIGVPILSLLARVKYRVSIRDFHCGLRGIDKEYYMMLKLAQSGMEFATEMVGAFAQHGAKVLEIPTVLRRDRRVTLRPHLRTLRDGWRHLRLILFDR